MQIISLNILGGAIFEPLREFLVKESAKTDFFCFQEVYDSASDQLLEASAKSNIFSELQTMLPDFDGYFETTEANFFGYVGVSSGLAIFAKKNIEILSHGQILVAWHEGEPQTNMQYVRFGSGKSQYTLAHVHGVIWPGSKIDSPDRLMQSVNIDAFLEKETDRKILCGDFNLMPNTESMALIEEIGMRDLIKDYKIETTRSKLDNQKYGPDDRQSFADYIFVSQEVKVLNFEVPNVTVSDHLPLKLIFE